MSAFRRNQSHVPYKGASPLKSKVKHVHLMLKAVLSGPSLINGSKKVPNDSHLSAMIFTVSVPNGRFTAALLRRPRNSAVNLPTQWSSIELYSGDKAFFVGPLQTNISSCPPIQTLFKLISSAHPLDRSSDWISQYRRESAHDPVRKPLRRGNTRQGLEESRPRSNQ